VGCVHVLPATPEADTGLVRRLHEVVGWAGRPAAYGPGAPPYRSDVSMFRSERASMVGSLRTAALE
jgi:hypothetical protein